MSRHLSSAVRRGPVLAVVAGALVVGGLLDRAGAPAAAPASAPVEPVPVAAPAAALSSSWFCAGATDGGSGSAPGQIVIANDGPRPAQGTVTIVASAAPPVRVPVTVGAHASASVPETVPGGSPWVGAVVDIDAGSVGVDQAVSGPLGETVSACATSGSNHWFFASGQTRINADTDISLLNPYPSDSIVDLSFSTDQGIEAPQDFQGIDVPADGMVSVDLGSHLRRRASIATMVTARAGSVVAWETQTVTPPGQGQPVVGTPAAASPMADPALPVPGVSVTLGAPSPATTWMWPDGLAGNGMDEQYVIFNPGPKPAQVRLSVGLQQGTAEPFDLSVGPDQVVPVVSEQQARIPAGVPHSATLQSENGVGVVAVRVVTAQNSAPSGAPGRTGVTAVPGGRVPASRWLIPAPSADPQHLAWVVVMNPGPRPVQVALNQLAGAGEAPVPGAGTTTLGGGGRLAVPVPAGVSAPLVVDASGPVCAESDLYGTAGAAGVSATFGIPLT